MLQRRPHKDPHSDPDTYFGHGKVKELKELPIESDADLVVADDELSARQQRNLLSPYLAYP